MTIVNITDKLLDSVSDVINEMKLAECKPFSQSAQLHLNPDSPFVQNLFWGDLQAVRAQVPDDWLGASDGMSGIVSVTNEDGKVVSESLHLKFGRSVPMPLMYGGWNQRVSPPLDPEAGEIQPYAQNMRETETLKIKWGKVRVQVTEFLQTCKSLNEGLKIWPQLSMYIPKEYLDRVAADKVKKAAPVSSAAAAFASLDTNLLVSSAVTARLSGHKPV